MRLVGKWLMRIRKYLEPARDYFAFPHCKHRSFANEQSIPSSIPCVGSLGVHIIQEDGMPLEYWDIHTLYQSEKGMK